MLQRKVLENYPWRRGVESSHGLVLALRWKGKINAKGHTMLIIFGGLLGRATQEACVAVCAGGSVGGVERVRLTQGVVKCWLS